MSAAVHAPDLLGADYIDLPAHTQPGGFDHADVLESRLYVAHTANDAVDVIDLPSQRFLRSLPNHREAAGVLAAAEKQLLFVSNRGDDSVSFLDATTEREIARLSAGIRPNGLAYDAEHDLLLVANVGDPAKPESHTVSIISVADRKSRSTIRVAGRTRWAVHVPELGRFFVNIADPAQMVVIASASPDRPTPSCQCRWRARTAWPTIRIPGDCSARATPANSWPSMPRPAV